MKNIQAVLVLSTLIILASCGSSKKVTTTPGTPQETSRLLPPLPVSEINIPVKVYMKPLLSMMDSSTAKEFTSEKWPDYYPSSCDFRYKYKFIRSPFVFSCVNNKVTIAFRGYYQIAGSRTICAINRPVSPWVNGSCGFGNETMRRVDISISSLLNLLPNHQIQTTTRLNNVNPIDKCQVTLMQNDLTGQIMDSIKSSLQTYAVTFDKFVQTLNNNPLLQQWRSGGSRVMPVSNYGYLNLNPTGLRVGKFNVVKDTLYFSLGFNGNPKFSSDSNRLVTHAPLPAISNTDHNGQISTYLDAVYEYKFFNKLLNDSLSNKPFEVDGRTFVIKDVNIGGTNTGKVQIDVSFTGNRKGVLHLSGTPLLDTSRQVLSMPDISFAVDTKDMMIKIAQGLFHKKIMKQLANKTVLDIAALIQKNKAAIEARINQQVTDWMSTTGTFQEIKLVGLLPQKDYIQVQAYIKANISLIGKPPVSLLK